MHKAIMAGATAAALLASSLMAEAAKDKSERREKPRVEQVEEPHEILREDHRGAGPVLDFVGDVFLGVVKVATAPLALLAEIGRDGWHGRPERELLIDDGGAYATNAEEARAYYGAGARFYGPPPGHFPLH